MTKEEFEARHPYPIHTRITRLYKFFKYDDQHLDRLESIFLNRRLYHSKPADFNDPWEARPWVRFPETRKELSVFRGRMIRGVRKEHGLSKREASKSVSEALANKEEFVRNWLDATGQTFGETLICSLSADPANTLLWSHYSDSHRGFCIGFDTAKLPFHLAIRVRYQDTYPTVSYPMDQYEALSILATKSSHWEYEKEYRIVHVTTSRTPPGRYAGQFAVLPNDSIAEVFFGAKMSEEHRESIRDMINRGPFGPCLRAAVISPSSYSLSFEPDS